MDFKTKKAAYNNLQGKQFFEADQALLKSIRPNNPFADKTAVSDSTKEKLQREILWFLLDMVSIEKIEENRGVEPGKIIPLKNVAQLTLEKIQAKLAEIEKTAPETKEQFDAVMHEFEIVGADIEKLTDDETSILGDAFPSTVEKVVAVYVNQLIGLLQAAETIEAANAKLEEILGLAILLPEEAALAVSNLANSVNPFKTTEANVFNNKVAELKALDLSDPKIDYGIVSELFDFFKLTSADGQKKAAKVEALKLFLESQPIVNESKNEELNDIVSDLKQENEILTEKVDALTDKIDDLADEISEQKKS